VPSFWRGRRGRERGIYGGLYRLRREEQIFRAASSFVDGQKERGGRERSSISSFEKERRNSFAARRQEFSSITFIFMERREKKEMSFDICAINQQLRLGRSRGKREEDLSSNGGGKERSRRFHFRKDLHATKRKERQGRNPMLTSLPEMGGGETIFVGAAGPYVSGAKKEGERGGEE